MSVSKLCPFLNCVHFLESIIFCLWQDLNLEWDLVTLLVMSGAGWVISVSHLLMVLLTDRLRTQDSLSPRGWGSQVQIQVGWYGSVAEGGVGGRRGNFQWGHRLGEDLQSNLKENILRSSQFQFREAFKKKKSVTKTGPDPPPNVNNFTLFFWRLP